MNIDLFRKYRKPGYTIGILSIDGQRICETLEDTDRGITQQMTPLQVAQQKIKGKTAIPTGVYNVNINFSPRFRKELPILEDVTGFEGIRIHCLDDKTEILTTKGWKNIDTYNNEDLITFNRQSSEYQVLPNIETVIREVDEDLYVAEGKVNFATTDKHNHWVEVKKRDGSKEWQTRTADNIPGGSSFRISGKNNTEKLNSKFMLLYKLAFALVADGFIRKYKQGCCNVMFHFKKQRKIEMIESYLSELNEDYTKRRNDDGTTVVSVNTELSKILCNLLDEPDTDYKNYKLFPYSFYGLNSEDLLELLDTYLFFDGKYANYTHTNCRIINSSHLQRIEQLQIFAVLAGCSTYLHRANDRDGYELRYTPCEKKMSEVITKQPYKGRVWCVSNNNETIIIRRGGRTMITQNCGNTADDTEGCILPGKNTKVGMVTNSRVWTENIVTRIKKALLRGEAVKIKIHW